MTPGLRTAALAAFLAASQLAACGGSDEPAAQRQTTLGVVLGADESASNGTYSWKGIPYAQAPVGALRWKPPADLAPWSGIRTAQEFGNACVQNGRLYGPGRNNRYDATIGASLGQATGSEDCLYLNVWQPSQPAAAPRPVIVFVHGGSNITGYTADPVYHGANLARTADAAVVTVNYRLGIFGFLNQDKLKTGDALADSGNFALLDLVKALQFVNANIAQFGGDPRNVTVMGHSAGAVNVFSLLASPVVTAIDPPLFHRAVPLSGGISLAANLPAGSFPTLQPAAVAATQGNQLLAQLLIADGLATDAAGATAYIAGRSAAQLAGYLRSKPADTLLAVVRTRLAPLGLSGSNPIPEGTVLPADPIAAIRAGRYLKVPVLAGYTRDEGKLFPAFLALSPALGGASGRLIDDATVFDIVSGYDAEVAPTTTVEQWIPAAYLPVDAPVTGFNARTALLTRVFFQANRDNVLDALKAQQPSVWAWQFEWDVLPAPFDAIFGAAHGFDMPFVFGTFGPSLYSRIANTRANAPGRLALSDAMMRSLGAFARNGDPNDAALGTTWPTWPRQLVLDADADAKAITVR